MKKCNFFPYLVVVLMMFFGMSLNAQSYLSSKDAIKAVQGAINQNIGMSTTTKTHVPVTGTVVTAREYQASLDRPTKVKALKVEYGKILLQELNAGIPVKDALLKAASVMEIPAKTRGELDVFQEVDTFFRNLLAK
ncbi:MAG TPA: hypothetical protein PK047_00795 [Saprospiraceae bacterium]|nr:hypothetical protein [Saprospiraceae bacterium]HRO07374.1 hypothetical protein [Saprospiraceae bacterium]HRP40657.1 hypothetical protein [Saprospiraceae bacterium]